MKKIFKDKVELANFLLFEEYHPRTWGVLKDFSKTQIYNYHNGKMQDKYIKGKPILSQLSKEYQLSLYKYVVAFCDFIEEKEIPFPCEYTLNYDDFYDSYSVEFNPYIEQLSLFEGIEEIPVLRKTQI